MSSPTVGRTVWAFLHDLFSENLPWFLVIIAVAFIGYMLIHPNIVKEWNVLLSTAIARIVPRKRKKTFERRIELTLQRARDNTEKVIPEYVQRFLPYSLKVEWIEPKEDSAQESIESLVNDKQIILYVPSYKNEEKQTVSILYNYCMKAFATRPKCIMKDDDKKATDLLVTGKMAQNAGYHIYDYFNRVYVKEILNNETSFRRSYDELKKIDIDGLFLPIFINEADKLACRINESGENKNAFDTLEHFKQYLLTIIEKRQDENVKLDFHENGINVHIELAVGSWGTQRQIQGIITKLESLVNSRSVDTIYVIASGYKMKSANDIVTGLEEKVTQDIYEPRYTQYKRFTNAVKGTESICYEINLNQ